MANQTIHGEMDALKKLFNETRTLVNDGLGTPQVNAGLVSHCCVRLSGLTEVVHTLLLRDYFKDKCPLQARNFISAKAKSSSNFNAKKCIDFWMCLSSEWGQELGSRVEMQAEGRWAAALNGVYNVRNSQAHGGNQSATLITATQWMADIFEYFEFVQSSFLSS